MQDSIDLSLLRFQFAIQDLQADIGHIEVNQVNWSGVDGVKDI